MSRADTISMGIRLPVRNDSVARRLVDIVVAATCLVVLAPLLTVLACWVRASSRGPAIYRQPRMGRGAVPFRIWKFRTMVVGADCMGPLVSGCRDGRITRAGTWLRASRLDELPQLVNLLRGDITLFGPRPEVPHFLAHYTAAERQVLTVRPGIVGPGALLFVEEQSDLDTVPDPERHYVQRQLHPKLALDLTYLQHRTVRADLRLLAQTAAVVTGLAFGQRRRTP